MTSRAKTSLLMLPLSLVLASSPLRPASAGPIFLDADTLDTGSELTSTPLSTAFGSVSLNGTISAGTDPETIAAGSSGNVFRQIEAASGTLDFGFEVLSIALLYGGNAGSFEIEARDIDGISVDSFSQADTGAGQAAGPITLSGSGIRSLFWRDPTAGSSWIDNLDITPIPEPGSIALAAVGLIALWAVARLSETSTSGMRARQEASQCISPLELPSSPLSA